MSASSYVQVYRATFNRGLGAVLMGLAGVLLVSLVASGSPEHVLRYAGGAALVGVVGFLGYWRPQVVVTDDGVELHNPLRSARLPWGAVRLVEGRYGLRIQTTDGRYDAWAAPAPTGMGRARHQQSEAATMVAQRWERAQALGHAGADVPVQWERDRVATGAAAGVAALAVLGPLLGAVL